MNLIKFNINQNIQATGKYIIISSTSIDCTQITAVNSIQRGRYINILISTLNGNYELDTLIQQKIIVDNLIKEKLLPRIKYCRMHQTAFTSKNNTYSIYQIENKLDNMINILNRMVEKKPT